MVISKKLKNTFMAIDGTDFLEALSAFTEHVIDTIDSEYSYFLIMDDCSSIIVSPTHVLDFHSPEEACLFFNSARVNNMYKEWFPTLDDIIKQFDMRVKASREVSNDL